MQKKSDKVRENNMMVLLKMETSFHIMRSRKTFHAHKDEISFAIKPVQTVNFLPRRFHCMRKRHGRFLC